MIRPRRPRTLGRALAGAVATAVGFTGCIAGGALLVTMNAPTPDGVMVPEPSSPATVAPTPAPSRLDALVARYGCSRTGLGEGVIPGRSIIADASGRVRVVTFDRGWAAYTGDAPGTLLAVCP